MVGDRSEDTTNLVRPPSPQAMASARALKTSLRKLISSRLGALSSAAIRSQSAAVAEAVLRHRSYRQAQAVGVYLSMERECQTDAIVRHALADGKRVYVPRCGSKTQMSLLRLLSADEDRLFDKTKWGIPEPPATYNTTADGTEHQREALEVAEVDTERVLVICPGMAFSRARISSSVSDAAENTHFRGDSGGPVTGDGDDVEAADAGASDAARRIGTVLNKRLGHGAGYYDRYLRSFNTSRADVGLGPVETIGICLPCQYLGDERTTSIPVHAGEAGTIDEQDGDLVIPWTESDVAMNHVIHG